MDLIKVIDEHIDSPDVFKSYRNSMNMYPSQASVKYHNHAYGEDEVQGACLRQVYYRCTGVTPEPFTVRTRYIFAMGNMIEDYFTEQLKQSGSWLGNSIKFFDTDISLSGELDILVKDNVSDKPVIVELKSTSGYYSWKEIAGNKSTKGKPKPAHLLQILLYLYHFRDQAEKGVLLYFNRDNVERHQFIIELHKEDGKHYPVIDGQVYRAFSVEDIRDRYVEATDYIDKGIVPPKDYEDKYTPERIEILYARGKIVKTKYEKYKQNPQKNPVGDWTCAYCSYKGQCEKDN